MEKLKEQVKKQIDMIVEQGVKPVDVDRLGKLVDIHKDLANEDYWKMKEEGMEMRYKYGRDKYGESYGRRARDSRGRYTEGYMGRGYRGEDMIDEMAYHYGNYNEGREQYGADEETMKSFKYMLKSFKDYYKHLKEEASSPQEVKLLEETAREMLEM